jgi:Tol biopolymer transport system component
VKKESVVHRTIAVTLGVAAITVLSAVPTTASSPAPTLAADVPLVAGEPWIAYQTTTPRGHAIFLVRPDGTDAHFPLASVPGGQQLHPDWSPDGNRLVFNVDNLGGTLDLWTAETSDWSIKKVVACVAPCVWADEPAWSPDGHLIAFQRHTQTESGEISTVELLDPATGEDRTVYTAGPEVQLYAPRWSPDGGSLVLEMPAFTKSGDVTSDSLGILDVTPATPTMHTIGPDGLLANNPDWSPDGTLIAFSAPIAGGDPGGALSDLWLIHPDGSGLRQLTDVAKSGGSAVQPTFTPDGTRVIFKLDAVDGYSNAMATIAIDGSYLRPATGSGPIYGWHARLRPTP